MGETVSGKHYSAFVASLTCNQQYQPAAKRINRQVRLSKLIKRKQTEDNVRTSSTKQSSWDCALKKPLFGISVPLFWDIHLAFIWQASNRATKKERSSSNHQTHTFNAQEKDYVSSSRRSTQLKKQVIPWLSTPTQIPNRISQASRWWVVSKTIASLNASYNWTDEA